ncbi:nucleoside hydrolase [Jannaschia marina]|uniref:nucleoside hydrolase n=1 Tax=Jannaschia marina TaxID=2741674 RepID=UPI0015C6C557|nr:nucleoside hydrolase [Jannaschia marina]
MSGVWVDTDFGFDDLWALLLLRHLGRPVAGVSLVAGNAAMAQVAANALGAKQAYGFDWPVWAGAARPLARSQETAERILGPRGMRSRGRHLPRVDTAGLRDGAVGALRDWLCADGDDARPVLALGPLTNIARLVQRHPEALPRISRLVWMGGSAGAGNHTPRAEFNAVADAEALACVLGAGLALDVVDLTFCRGVAFGAGDLPETDPLTRDLLGGYLDIALARGRTGMAIYDPLAALALAAPDRIGFTPCKIEVSTGRGPDYGATSISPAPGTGTRLATRAAGDLARICLDALKREALHGP